jgi:hypothetical protein
MKGRCRVKKPSKRIRIPTSGSRPDPRDSGAEEAPKAGPPVASDVPAADPHEDVHTDDVDADATPPLGIRITTPTPRS